MPASAAQNCPVYADWLNASGTLSFVDLPLPALSSGQHDATDLNSAEAVTKPDQEWLGAVLEGKSTMPMLNEDTMHLLEKTIDKYGTAGDTCTEFAIRDLLTDLRHFCDQHEVDFDVSLEGSLDVYLEEQESADNERSDFSCRDVEGEQIMTSCDNDKQGEYSAI